jgi:ketosteroid isomerase-like protein
MSEENVELFKRAIDAGNRRDWESLLETLDPEVEWHPGLAASLAGEATIYRGREEVREVLQEYLEALSDLRLEFSDIRDLGDQVLAVGQIRGHGAESGVEVESPLAYLIQVRNGKATRVRAYLDPKEALEAAGLSEDR